MFFREDVKLCSASGAKKRIPWQPQSLVFVFSTNQRKRKIKTDFTEINTYKQREMKSKYSAGIELDGRMDGQLFFYRIDIFKLSGATNKKLKKHRVKEILLCSQSVSRVDWKRRTRSPTHIINFNLLKIKRHHFLFDVPVYRLPTLLLVVPPVLALLASQPASLASQTHNM